MGMYDQIACRYPLPGTPPAFVKKEHRFQTKDLGCTLTTYTIHDNGRFEIPDFTGDLCFYTSNIAGAGPGVYTRDGEDAETVEYVAAIFNGGVQRIVETERTRKPAIPVAKMFEGNPPPPTEDQIAEWREREAESLCGRTMYVLWGGQREGYYAVVVAEGPKQWCLKSADGTLEVFDRRMRGNILWDTEADAKHSRAEREAIMDRRRREYEEHVKAKTGATA